jgi:hypothetical protein
MMRAISRVSATGATVFLLAILSECGGRRTPVTGSTSPQVTSRTLPLARLLVLETSGPPPSDTSLTFTTGEPRIIVLRQGPPENIVFARLAFAASAFADSGLAVKVEVHPRPGVYGLDFTTSLPLRQQGATLVFEYARFFSAPARARQIYGSDVAFEQALSIARLIPNSQAELLPPFRPAADNLGAELPAPGSYVVVAPQ